MTEATVEPVKRKWGQKVASIFKRVLLLVVLFYVSCVVIYAFDAPRVSVDYVERVQRKIDAVPVTERGWVIYREALRPGYLEEISSGRPKKRSGEDPNGYQEIIVGDPEWPQVEAWCKAHQPLLEAIRRGAQKPIFGLGIQEFEELGLEDQKALAWSAELVGAPVKMPVTVVDGLAHHMVHNRYPCYGSAVKRFYRLLASDILAAGVSGDSVRVVADYRAALGLARQYHGTGWGDDQIHALLRMAEVNRELTDVFYARPEIFSDADLAALAGLVGDGQYRLRPDFSSSADAANDFLQRVYTEPTVGPGRVTNQGMRVLRKKYGLYEPHKDPTDGQMWGGMLPVMPVIAWWTPSRRHQERLVESFVKASEADEAEPLWVLLGKTTRAEALNAATPWGSDPVAGYMLHDFCLVWLRDSDSVLMHKRHDAMMDALAAGIAMERYKRAQGTYPASTAELAPGFLASAPVDPSTGLGLLMKVREGRAILYGRGVDGRDDGASPASYGLNYGKIARNEGEDWILFPGPQEGLVGLLKGDGGGRQ
jgi:hypothetical protein